MSPVLFSLHGEELLLLVSRLDLLLSPLDRCTGKVLTVAELVHQLGLAMLVLVSLDRPVNIFTMVYMYNQHTSDVFNLNALHRVTS